jgi:hypothetical protein
LLVEALCGDTTGLEGRDGAREQSSEGECSDGGGNDHLSGRGGRREIERRPASERAERFSCGVQRSTERWDERGVRSTLSRPTH